MSPNSVAYVLAKASVLRTCDAVYLELLHRLGVKSLRGYETGVTL